MYRYLLSRTWSLGGSRNHNRLLWVMLNPSTADDHTNDATIRRCIDFSRRWGYGGLDVVNLLAIRATRPADILALPDPIGPDNNEAIERAIRSHRDVVAAWGASRPKYAAAAAESQINFVCKTAEAAGVQLVCLGKTKAGHPRHPLYVKQNTSLVKWRV